MYPTEVLRQEHRTIDVLLDCLVESVFAAARDGSPDATRLKRLVRALSVLLGRWHRQKEEELFFPLIQVRGVAKQVMDAAFLQEAHDTLGGDVCALGEVIERATENPSLWATVSFRAVDLANRARGHMRMEEQIVFPLAEASLFESDREALISAFRRVELLDPFPGTHEDIQRLVDERDPRGTATGGADGRHGADRRWGGQVPALVRACA